MVFLSHAHLELAGHILRADFGEVVETICSRLLTHGAATLSELIHAVQLPPSKVRTSLLVLLQHNIVHCVARPELGAASQRRRAAGVATVQYDARIDEIFCRPWFPRMMLAVRKRFGADEELLLQLLLVNGRLSSEQLLSRASDAYASSRGLRADSQELIDKRIAFIAAATRLEVRARGACGLCPPPPPSMLPCPPSMRPCPPTVPSHRGTGRPRASSRTPRRSPPPSSSTTT